TASDPVVGGYASGVNRVEYRLDSGSFTVTTSPLTLSGLAEGNHTFPARAFDNAGNVSAPARFARVIDMMAPVATITAQPPAFTNGTSASFSFTSSDPLSGGVSSGVHHLEYSLDGGSFTTAASPVSFSGLAEGGHNFRVRAVDNAGNTGAAA